MRILILRPEPGAGETAARARALGLEAVTAPLFEVLALDWRPPDPADFDSVMLTSAHAARCGGDGMTPFFGLPCYAVGEATEAAARAAGFGDVRTGRADGAALLAKMASDGVRAAFHPCGTDRIDLFHPDVRLMSVPVYAARARERLAPEAEAALADGALVLLHSPRAASLFGRLFRGQRAGVAIAAISPSVAAAAGLGWRSVAVAEHPRDPALLELAAKLCQTARE